jgi:DNA-binding GntR family transcriptional regulator
MTNPGKKAAEGPQYSFASLSAPDAGRRTTTDEIFDNIYNEIVSMRLEPGTKLSEVDVARQFNVSRQPVREAFIRLNNLKLLQIRPQRATVVRKISIKDVFDARFVRMAVEVEVARRACEKFEVKHQAGFEENLALQKSAVDANDYDTFHALDNEFHRMLCKTAGRESAFDTIKERRTPEERLCILSLARRSEFENVYQDHVEIYDLLKSNDGEGVVALLRKHLSRLDAVIEEVSRSHPNYFED